MPGGGPAAAPVAAMRRRTEEAGIDMWRVVATTEHRTVEALTALDWVPQRE